MVAPEMFTPNLGTKHCSRYTSIYGIHFFSELSRLILYDKFALLGTDHSGSRLLFHIIFFSKHT